MELDDYKDYKNKILERLPSNESYQMYKNLLEVFVQDCWLPVSQPYFGNTTKAKAAILFELQEKFLSFNEDRVVYSKRLPDKL